MEAILPAGTQVVTLVDAPRAPRGAVGVIVREPCDPEHSYRIRFPDGREGSYGRRALAVRKEHTREHGAVPDDVLREHVIYVAVVGSRAYGLEHDGSDTDRRGIYLPPAELHWSLLGLPGEIERHESQECYWEIEKFLQMALRANPNVLECLYTPLVERAEPVALEILALRERFLSRRIYQTFGGYVMSQFKKLETDVRLRGEPRWKHAMHLLRLLQVGTSALLEGRIEVRVPQSARERLLAVRRGELSWEACNAWRLELHAELDRAFSRTALPERPDYAAADALLVRARRSMVR